MSEQGQKVDLVLTDIVMPEMDGIELANRLQSLAPATRILFMSGYLDETLDTHAFDQDTMSLLKKPFGAEELVRRVKQMLEGLI
jgi:CheY-like chemotaxis protein